MLRKKIPAVSIVIRTKNEARWIWKTLKAIKSQSITPDEIVLIDNLSEDSTVTLAKEFGATKILNIENYSPGRALNLGMHQTTSDFVVFLSAHCVPCDEFWLENLISSFHNDQIAATYGRQLPLPFSSDTDKSDLYAVFRNESKVQSSDGFMNNANSAILRRVWQQIKFDETVTNIEDRLWGKTVISKGFKIAYNADATVFHHNGMHKSGERANQASTVYVLENMIHSDLQKDTEKYRSVFNDSFLPIIIGSRNDLINKRIKLFNDEIAPTKSHFLDPTTILIGRNESEIWNATDSSVDKFRLDAYVNVKNFILNQIKTLHPKVRYVFVIFTESLSMDSEVLLESLNKMIFENNVLVRIGTDCTNMQFKDLFVETEGGLYNFIAEIDPLLAQGL
jgi:glycosyltransferase involved in cell wall biosynthesis